MDPGFPQHGHRIVGGGFGGPAEAVEAKPEVAVRRERVLGGELEDHAPPRVDDERPNEGGQGGDVVDDVVADDDIGRRRPRGGVRPRSLHDLDVYSGGSALPEEGFEHRGGGVDTDQRLRPPGERHGGRPRATADIQDAPGDGQSFQRSRVGWSRSSGGMLRAPGEELHGETPGGLGRLFEDCLGNGPGLEGAAPSESSLWAHDGHRTAESRGPESEKRPLEPRGPGSKDLSIGENN